MTTTQFVDDDQLVHQYVKGKESALETLIQRHKSKLFTYILITVKDRDLSEDIFQDTFFKVINTLKKGQYNEEGKFLSWIIRIAHNLIIDHFRKNKRMPVVSSAVGEDGEGYDIFNLIGSEDVNAEEHLEGKQVRQNLRKLVESLPEEQREVLMMRNYYDMSFKEIADATNVSINTALGRMRYALINLRRMVEESNMVLYG